MGLLDIAHGPSEPSSSGSFLNRSGLFLLDQSLKLCCDIWTLLNFNDRAGSFMDTSLSRTKLGLYFLCWLSFFPWSILEFPPKP